MTLTAVHPTAIADLLRRWLTRRLARGELSWLEEKQRQIAGGAPARTFFTAFSAVPRYTGKEALQPSSEELQAAESARPGWRPDRWSLDQAARTLLVLALPTEPTATYEQTLKAVFEAADVGELVALYQALPLLPAPERHQKQAAEGVRSNMTAVFNAIALHNPYPADHLEQLAWNQMVLKALFVGSPLAQIQGLDRRTNPALAQMLIDYAHERWAAGRSVSPELWRAIGPFTNPAMAADLERVLASSDPAQQGAAALACALSETPQVQALLHAYPDLQAQIQSGQLTWSSLPVAAR